MPSLRLITPVILTLDEAPNIGRTLQQLQWAQRIVVVDSGSRDGTIDILSSFTNVDVIFRRFDTHRQQWNFALRQARTDWVLALDADYYIPAELVTEIEDIPNDTALNGFFAPFRCVVFGRVLKRGLYPPRQVLFRREQAVFENDGHTQRIVVRGASGHVKHPILHDDRKSLDRWLRNQASYTQLETQKLMATPFANLGWPDRVRRTRLLGPPAVLLYVLFGKGLVLEGWPGWYYALERTAAELLLSLSLIRQNSSE